MSDQPELKRSLGLVDATMIVAGSMIGSGIFIVSSDMARAVGSSGFLILLWIITGVITVMAALSYGELAGMMPKAGGQFVYIQRAFGNLTSFLYGWTVFTVISTGVIAAVAVAFMKYSAIFFPSLNNEILNIGQGKFIITVGQLYAIASIVLLTFINTGGVNSGKLIQTVFTSAKLIALFALIVLGIWIGMKNDTLALNFSNAWDASTTTFKDGVLTVVPIAGIALLGAMGSTIINSLFSADAWNNVTFISGEIKDPKKNIPRSLFAGTLIVTVIYILANISYLSLLPLKGDPNTADVVGQGIQFAAGEGLWSSPKNDRVGAAAASVIFGNTGVAIMAVLIMISTFGCNNGLILAGARVYYAMAKDKLFFKKAGAVNANSVPANALWFQCAWASALCLTGTYSDLVAYSTFASMIFYIVTIVGIFVLRKKEPDADRPYKAFGYPVIPALYIVAALAICVILIIYDGRNTGFGLGCVALGIPVYYLTVGKKKNKYHAGCRDGTERSRPFAGVKLNETNMSFRNILREYFTFNRRERNGVFVLLSIIVLLLICLSFSSQFYPAVKTDFSEFEKEVAAFEAEQKTIDGPVADEREAYTAESRTTYDHKKNRDKNGSENKYVKNTTFQRSPEYISQKPEPLRIELNTADTTELKKLRGIGSSFAKRIVKYRDLLGGYVSKEQLMEVYGFDPEKFELVSPFVTIDPAKARKVNINTSTPEEMKSHPYIRWKLAGIIAAYRKNHGAFSSVDDMRKIDLVTDSLFSKIAPYLSVE